MQTLKFLCYLNLRGIDIVKLYKVPFFKKMIREFHDIAREEMKFKIGALNYREKSKYYRIFVKNHVTHNDDKRCLCQLMYKSLLIYLRETAQNPE